MFYTGSITRANHRPPLSRRPWRLLTAVLLLASVSPSLARAQDTVATAYGWNARLMAGAGLRNSLEFVGREADGLGLVSTLRLGYRGRLPGPLSYSLGVEGLFGQHRGTLGEVGDYKARTARIGVEGLVGVRVPSTKLSVEAGMQMRNQADLDDFELRRRDNLRFDLRLAASYPLCARLHATAMVARGLRNRDDSHYLADPRLQASAGVVWYFRNPDRS